MITKITKSKTPAGLVTKRFIFPEINTKRYTLEEIKKSESVNGDDYLARMIFETQEYLHKKYDEQQGEIKNAK